MCVYACVHDAWVPEPQQALVIEREVFARMKGGPTRTHDSQEAALRFVPEELLLQYEAKIHFAEERVAVATEVGEPSRTSISCCGLPRLGCVVFTVAYFVECCAGVVLGEGREWRWHLPLP